MKSLCGTVRTELSGWRSVVATLAGAALTSVCAQIGFYLPGNPIPVTLQVFAVALCSMMLGGRLAAISQIQYLAAGLLGAPVFAGFKGGVGALAGPTGGYLLG
ncbi:MAG: biotin transporter BioY, partial [Armatimonadetes bacterium]|nr:biotin transporter BioY [Armatimonadota bacterium]